MKSSPMSSATEEMAMIATHRIFQIVSAVFFAGAGVSASAQTTFSTNAPFVTVGAAPMGKQPSVQAADQEIFSYVPAIPDMNFPYSPYAGAQLTLDHASPQAQIDSARLYAYALTTGVYQGVTARFRFWNAYQASANPVFSKPVEFVVDLTACPCNFVAGMAYSVDITLPKPVYTEGTSVGFSQVWETDTGDGVQAVSSDLVPALDTSGRAPATGRVLAAYADLGHSPDDLDFMPADAVAGSALGVGLNGVPLKLDQCTGAANFQDQFDEEFDDASAFYQRWKANPNSGTFTVGSGYLALSAPGNALQFPYISPGGQTTAIPSAGDFSVRWLAVYTGVGSAGDGEMVISKGTPLNGNDGTADPSTVAARAWQDSGGFYVYANTGGGVQKLGGSEGTALHDMEYCWAKGNVEIWKDGQKILGQTAQPAQRPDSLWFGNSVVAGGGPWNAVTLYRVLVRGNQASLSDHIFSDGFGPPVGDQ
jgi:hypothetical protein